MLIGGVYDAVLILLDLFCDLEFVLNVADCKGILVSLLIYLNDFVLFVRTIHLPLQLQRL